MLCCLMAIPEHIDRYLHLLFSFIHKLHIMIMQTGCDFRPFSNLIATSSVSNITDYCGYFILSTNRHVVLMSPRMNAHVDINDEQR